MTSKIKVDNIENQCGGAVVTKCGATTTISGSVVKADDIQAADGGNLINQCGTTITLGASGDTINLASGASQTGFGRTGTVDWDTTPKTASFTAVSGNGYFVNTTSGAITVTLPAGSAGDIISLADYAATWQTNNLTVSPNGTDKIGSQNTDAVLSTQGQSVTFVYVDGTQGWINTMDSTSNVRGEAFISATGGTITCCGDYKIHTFTGPGTFCVSRLAPGPSGNPNVVDYLVVAGGGSGGNGGGLGSGGGAGGFRLSNGTCMPAPLTSPLANPTGLTATVTSFPITVGAGGAAFYGSGNPGANSIFSTITSAGGGGGATGNSGGSPGGSGGGSSGSTTSPGPANPFPGGTGNTPPVSPSQGNNGGAGWDGRALNTQGGGGGGAAVVGGNASSGAGAPGGDGSYVSPSFAGTNGTTGPVPSTRYFSGGGGGATDSPTSNLYPGGAGGGGQGGNTGAVAGGVNTGGGGGAGADSCAVVSGGSGIVIIRYKFQ
jgi:hypothetical protein